MYLTLGKFFGLMKSIFGLVPGSAPPSKSGNNTFTGTNTFNNAVRTWTISGITAAGTDHTNATPLTADNNEVTTVDTGAGVILPVSGSGRRVAVWNLGVTGFTLNIYPNSGNTIAGAAANIPDLLPPGFGKTYFRNAAGPWDVESSDLANLITAVPGTVGTVGMDGNPGFDGNSGGGSGTPGTGGVGGPGGAAGQAGIVTLSMDASSLARVLARASNGAVGGVGGNGGTGGDSGPTTENGGAGGNGQIAGYGGYGGYVQVTALNNSTVIGVAVGGTPGTGAAGGNGGQGIAGADGSDGLPGGTGGAGGNSGNGGYGILLGNVQGSLVAGYALGGAGSSGGIGQDGINGGADGVAGGVGAIGGYAVIQATAAAAFAGGYCQGGDAVAGQDGADGGAAGTAGVYGQITASGIGSYAWGYTLGGWITASGDGSIAFGHSTSLNGISATDAGSMAWGNSEDTSAITAGNSGLAPGSTAFGYASNASLILASNSGTLAFGYAINGFNIIASGDGATTSGAAITGDVIASGTGSEARGDNVFAPADFSKAAGVGAATNFRGQRCRANGIFTDFGDAQATDLSPLSGDVDGAVTVELLGAATTRWVLPNNRAWAFRLLLVGRTTDGTGIAAYEITGTIVRGVDAASTTLKSTSTPTAIYATDAINTSVAVAADTTNGSLKVSVAGIVAKHAHWVASGYAVEVG